MNRFPLTLTALVVLSAPAWAQNFQQDWLDGLSREMHAYQGPLERKGEKTEVWLGASYAYNDNVFMDDQDEDGSSIVTPFLRVRGEYSDPLWNVVIDGIASWSEYFASETEDASDDQERIQVRVRYAGPVVDVQVANIFRNESDPTDVVFGDRIERIVNDTIVRGIVHLNDQFKLEAGGTFEVLRFRDSAFEASDNWNTRAGIGAAYQLPSGIDLVVQGGHFHIEPLNEGDPGVAPSTDGRWIKTGIRGEIVPTLYATVMGGWTKAESDDVAGAGTEEEDETGTADVHLMWEATEQITLYGDYSRLITYTASIGGDPYQIVNQFTTIAELRTTEQLSFRGRFQFDDAHSALGVEQEYISVGGRVSYLPQPQVILSVDVTWMSGEIEERDFETDNTIISAGIVLTN